nr:hypothetical protein [Streptomyces antimycoticus]
MTEDGDDDSVGILGGGNPELPMVPVSSLRKNLAATVDALQQVFADVAARGGTLPLAEAQLSFQVTASSGVQLIGTGQVQGTPADPDTNRRREVRLRGPARPRPRRPGAPLGTSGRRPPGVAADRPGAVRRTRRAQGCCWLWSPLPMTRRLTRRTPRPVERRDVSPYYLAQAA